MVGLNVIKNITGMLYSKSFLGLKITANTRVHPIYYCRRYGLPSVQRASCEERGQPSRRAMPFALREIRDDERSACPLSARQIMAIFSALEIISRL